jgi:hypothetical protein
VQRAILSRFAILSESTYVLFSPDKQAAVEKTAQEFKTEVWRLYAVVRR